MDFDANAWLDQGEADFNAQQPPAPQGAAQGFDANAWLDQGEQEYHQASQAQPVQSAQPPPAVPMAMQANQQMLPPAPANAPSMEVRETAFPLPGQPTIKETAPVQTGKNSFQLGLDAAGNWFNELPLVKELKTNPIEQTAANIDTGIPYGLMQIGDVAETLAYPINWTANQIVGAIPRGIEGSARMLSGGKFETPTMDSFYPQYEPLHAAQKYRDFMSQQEGYSPETFKLGGMAGQMAVPASTGIRAGSFAAAAGLGALENAIIGGITSAGDQLGETGRIDPAQTAVATALGVPLGALGGAAGHGLGILGGKIAEALKPKVPVRPPTAEQLGGGLQFAMPGQAQVSNNAGRYQVTSGPVKEFFDQFAPKAPPAEAIGLASAKTAQAPAAVAGKSAPSSMSEQMQAMMGAGMNDGPVFREISDNAMESALRKPSAQALPLAGDNLINRLVPATRETVFQGLGKNPTNAEFEATFRNALANAATKEEVKQIQSDAFRFMTGKIKGPVAKEMQSKINAVVDSRLNALQPRYMKLEGGGLGDVGDLSAKAAQSAKELMPKKPLQAEVSISAEEQLANEEKRLFPYAGDRKFGSIKQGHFWSPKELTDEQLSESIGLMRDGRSLNKTEELELRGFEQEVQRRQWRKQKGLDGNVSSEAEPDALWRQRRTAFGRNKADEGQPIAQFDQATQAAAQNVAEAKVQLDYQKAVLDDYAKKLYGMLEESGLTIGGAGKGANGAFITKNLVERLNVHDEAELAKLRESLSDGVKRETFKQHVAAITGGKFGGEGNFGLKIPNSKLPGDIEKAFDNIVKIKRAVLNTEKRYKFLKEYGQPYFEKAQEGLRAENPRTSFNASTKVKTPFKEDVDVNVSLDHNAMQLKLSKEADAIYQAEKAKKFEAQANDRNYQPKFDFTLNIQNVRNAVTKQILQDSQLPLGNKLAPQLVGALAAADMSRDHKNDPDWYTGVRATLEIGAMIGGGYAAAKWLSKPANVALGKYFRDSVDRIAALDEALGTNVQHEIFQYMGAITARNFGLKIDPDLRAHALSLLRNGDEQGALQLGLTQAQIDVLKKSSDLEKQLKGLIDEQIANGEAHVKQLASAGQKDGMIDDALKSLRGMSKALGPDTRGDTAAVEDYSTVMRHLFNFHFYANLPFELLNLGDMFILSSAKVGPVNLGKAIVSLGPTGDKELKTLMEHSNLAGGFTAERTQLGVQTGKLQKGPLFNPIKADKISADRTWLAALFQYRQSKAVLNGYAGTDEQFVKDLIKGNLDPTMALDAGAHASETLSRTLGADPVRINMDVWSSGTFAPYVGAFVRQPARTINLLTKYMQTGQFGKATSMLGAMVLVGGAAAVPIELQEAWKNTDPKAYFMAANIMNKMNIPAMVTGKTLSDKTKYALFPPAQAFSDPARAGVWDAFKKSYEVLSKLGNGDNITNGKVLAALTSVLTILKPVVMGVPVKPVLNATKAAYESYGSPVPGMQEKAQGKHVSYYNLLGQQYAQGEDVPLDKLGINPLQNIAGTLLPGEWESVKNRQMAEEEQARINSNWINRFAPQKGKNQYFVEQPPPQSENPLSFDWLFGPKRGYQTDPTSKVIGAFKK